MEIQIIHIAALLATGVVVGFASGLLGVGGCFIMVPVQYWILTSMGIDPGTAILFRDPCTPEAMAGGLLPQLRGILLFPVTLLRDGGYLRLGKAVGHVLQHRHLFR